MSKDSSKKQLNEKRSWINLLIWIVFALILRWQVLEPRWIPSGSMLPTLQLKDRILIEKIIPRITYSKSKHLKHDTVVVFSPPKSLIQEGYDKDSALIKRVVGLPGEKIEIHDGKLFREGKVVQENWREERIQYEMDEVKVPVNQIWVLGDNRNNSLDSHIWGGLPEENVIGTAIWRYWPLNRFGPIRFPLPQKIEQDHHDAIRSRK
tara:strand:- start:323 stop:943 length:621 start_codon:yes stop_codon:yes gene_type:complete